MNIFRKNRLLCRIKWPTLAILCVASYKNQTTPKRLQIKYTLAQNLDNQVSDWDVQQLDDVSDNTHHDETNTDSSDDTEVL